MFTVKWFESLESTNAYSIRHLKKMKHGDIVCAKEQVNGYGQHADEHSRKSWFSPNSRNLYFSLVIKEHLSLSIDSHFWIKLMSLSICDVLREKYLLSVVQIKFPNDLCVNNKKICGILTEASVCGNEFEGMVIGVGLNVNMPLHELNKIDQPATSIFNEVGDNLDEHECLELILGYFRVYYRNILNAGKFKIEDVRSRYEMEIRKYDN